MLRTMSRRVIASLVGFFVGFVVFQIVRPVADLPPAKSQLQITSITLKRQGCSDAELECPVYDLTLRSDGTGTFVGYKNNEEYDGKFDTVFDPQDFAYIAEQIERQRFFELPQQYATSPEQETVVLEVETSEGLRVVTTHNWSSTPNAIRTLQALVDHESYQVVWTEAE